jgi:hypothetical protein
MATLYFNTVSTGDPNWSNASNWWDGPQDADPPPTNNQPLPVTNDSVIIQSACSSNVPTTLDYYITIEGNVSLTLNAGSYYSSGYYIYCYGALYIEASQTLNASGISIFSGGVFYIYGNYNGIVDNNAGTVENYSEFNGSITANSGNINNNGSTFSVNITTNTGTINNTGSFYGTITLNDTVGTINNNGGTFSVNITTNTGTINNTGSYSGPVTTNNGNIINNSVYSNSSPLTNNNVFTNNSVFNNTSTLTNNNVFNNNSIFSHNGGTFTNNGTTTIAAAANLSLRPTSIFINNGTFTYGTNYTTRFKGEIFPQVPSSASWGNALL